MYTKVTHNIVEEHFHPRPMLGELIPTEVLPGQDLPNAVMNEATLVFRMDSRSLWAKYAWNLLNYSISMNAGLPGTPQVESRLLKAAAALGNFIVPYYGITAGNELGDKLAAIAKVGTQVVDAVRDKRSLDSFDTIWKELIDDLAEYLNELNPTQWPAILIKEMFTYLVNTWTKAIVTRYNEDWNENDEALNNLEKLVVSGIANHVNKGFSSIADIFSRGIIAQYPSLFAK
jgi:hypothetical protein